MAKISIIVPIFNTDQYLSRCIDSILSQTFCDFDLILINDGSTDNSGNICNEYALSDSRIVVLEQDNKGQATARNNAIDWVFSNSDSEWITFIDSDDWVCKAYLDALYSAATHNNALISMCYLKYTDQYSTSSFDVNNMVTKTYPPEEAYIYKDKFYAFACGKLYNKTLFKKIRFPEGIYWEDLAITYKLFFSTDRVSIIDDELYFYYQRQNGTCNSNWNIHQLDYITALEPQIAFFDELKLTNLKILAIKSLISNIYNYQYLRLKASNNIVDKRILILYLKRKMRKYLIAYKRTLNISIKSFPGYYELAFPIFMWFYWRFIALKRIIKRKNKNDPSD